MREQTQGCVLFADVSGSTKLYESIGDAAAHSAIGLCVKLLRALTEQHGGRVIKTIGDEVMAIFPETRSAGKAAVDIQLGVNEMAPIEKVQLGVRIGLHHGPVMEREVDICELMWTDTEDATQLVAHHVSTDAGDSLRLVYRGRVVIVSPERRSIVLGRDATAGLVVPDRMASRTHCEIEQRQDKFVLADRSSNGTFLSIDGDREIVLRREEALLRAHGFIALGQSRTTATEFVEFFCE